MNLENQRMKIVDESILLFSQVSLSKILSRRNLQYVGIRKSQFFPNRVVQRLGLATGLSCEFKSRANCLASLGLLSCSATTGMTLQLLCMLHRCASFGNLPAMSQLRGPAELHTFELFFTFSHTLSLYDSHLNIGFLIAKIQANLVRNKANKMVD